MIDKKKTIEQLLDEMEYRMNMHDQDTYKVLNRLYDADRTVKALEYGNRVIAKIQYGDKNISTTAGMDYETQTLLNEFIYLIEERAADIYRRYLEEVGASKK